MASTLKFTHLGGNFSITNSRKFLAHGIDKTPTITNETALLVKQWSTSGRGCFRHSPPYIPLNGGWGFTAF